MVGVKFIGRLGNQLFQIVFLQYLKSNNPKIRFFFINPHHSYISKYFDFNFFHNMTVGSKLYSMGTRLTPKFLNFKEVYIEPIQTPRAINVEDWTIYKGFYQSDWYLKNTPKPLKIEIKQKFKNKFRKEFGELFEKNKTIVVHIRRTDYLKYGKRDISLPMDYFRDRLDQIEDIETFKVIFVSDDMDHVKSFFPARPNFIFSSNDEITDFQIIMNADIAII